MLTLKAPLRHTRTSQGDVATACARVRAHEEQRRHATTVQPARRLVGESVERRHLDVREAGRCKLRLPIDLRRLVEGEVQARRVRPSRGNSRSAVDLPEPATAHTLGISSSPTDVATMASSSAVIAVVRGGGRDDGGGGGAAAADDDGPKRDESLAARAYGGGGGLAGARRRCAPMGAP